ncbi:MAG: ribosomal-protein-alanine N-acetyltransferase [Nitrospirae bacterium]|nr:MAG: ribosomal-protein-alanine N-acetyltransferase [Nitrospirota bacterium]
MTGSGRVMLLPMQERDLDEVLALEQASFTEPWTRKMFLGELRGNGFAVNVVARAGETGALMGYIMFWVVFEELHLMNLAVRPEARRRGLGTDLVRHALAVGTERGVRTVLLEVRASNLAALALYEGLGFARKCVRKGYYDHPREDAVIMTFFTEKGGATMLNEDPAILEVIRRESSEFKTLEETHHRLEDQLGELHKLHFLTAEEEQLKKRIQFDKLATKDKMAALVRNFKQSRSLAAGPSS